MLTGLANLFIAFLLLLTIFTTPAFAQNQNPIATGSPSLTTSLPNTISPTSPIYTDLLMHNMFHTFSCLVGGSSMIGHPCLTYQIQKDAQGVMQTVPVLSDANLSGGVLGATTSLIGALYENRPLKTTNYLASVGQNLGFVKEAKAQVGGSGAQILDPVLSLWKVSRNISYLIMTIIFTVIGMMVMFRNRINPQTVITAQAALPGLVIGLVMITFSYFLAGLISDLAFVGTNIVGYYFQAVQNKTPDQIAADANLVKDVNNTSVLRVFAPFTRMLNVGNITPALESVWDELGDPDSGFLDSFNFLSLDPQKVIRMLTTFMAFQIFSPISTLVPGWGSVAAGGLALAGGQIGTLQVAAWVLAFVGMLALLYTMFKLLLRLINTFLSIIYLTITGPFQFLFASLPGRQGIATDWILSMVGNVLAFPAVLAVFYFVALLLGPTYLDRYCDSPPTTGNNCPFKVSQLNQRDNNALLPNAYAQEEGSNPQVIQIVNSSSFPLFGGLDLSFIKLLLAFGALLATPAIPDIIMRAIGRASQAGQIIGQEIGAGTAAGQRYSGQFQSGVSGLAGQTGRMTDQAGYYGVVNQATKKVEWQKTYDPRYGAHIGQGSKIMMGLKGLNPFKKGGGH